MASHFVFLGPQGSGKGTVIGKIKCRYDVPHISTGDMFREALKEGTRFGNCAKGFMLDGFPRNLRQAEALSCITTIDTAVLLEVPEAVSLERLSGRRQCRECGTIFHLEFVPPRTEGICDECGGQLYQRDDDKPEAIRERLATYRCETMPIVDYYERAGVLVRVDGSGTVDEVVALIRAKLGSGQRADLAHF
jgi:adenylate kinase